MRTSRPVRVLCRASAARARHRAPSGVRPVGKPSTTPGVAEWRRRRVAPSAAASVVLLGKASHFTPGSGSSGRCRAGRGRRRAVPASARCTAPLAGSTSRRRDRRARRHFGEPPRDVVGQPRNQRGTSRRTARAERSCRASAGAQSPTRRRGSARRRRARRISAATTSPSARARSTTGPSAAIGLALQPLVVDLAHEAVDAVTTEMLEHERRQPRPRSAAVGFAHHGRQRLRGQSSSRSLRRRARSPSRRRARRSRPR